MSDQGKWFKLWEAALDDADLENLSVHQWYCWARFGVYLKKHGTGGKITLRPPAISLMNIFRLGSFSEVINMIRSFPNYTIKDSPITDPISGQFVTPNVTNATVTYFVTCRFWNKYQGDFSGDRVRKYRHRVTANVTAQEERRREVTSTSTSSARSASRLRAEGAQRLRDSQDESYLPQWKDDIPVIPDSERMTKEEMDAIKLKNMGPRPKKTWTT